MRSGVAVELYEHNPGVAFSGISRYTRELSQRLPDYMPVRLTTAIDPPLARRFSLLHQFPLGVRDHRPGNVVHFTQIMGCAQMLWRPVRPAVATVHDLGVLVCKEDEPLFTRLGRWVLDRQMDGLKRMDRFAVNAEYTRRCLVDLFGIAEERIHFVQLGVDLENFRPIPEAKALLEDRYGVRKREGVFDLIYTGSELPRKNLRTLLEAMALLKGRGYRLRLFKVGGAGGNRFRAEFLADARRFGLDGEVQLVGTVPEPDLPLFYNVADLAVTPTLLEGGFAWVVMEALACGRPAVATTAAHVRREAEDAVAIVAPRDAEQMAAAIARLVDDPEARERMGRLGRQTVSPFTWDATVRAMVDVYEQAAEDDRRKGGKWRK